MSAEGGTRAVVAALLANIGIAVTKFVAFALTGASSMLAEAIHSVADSGNQGLLLLGGRQAQTRRDAGAPVRLRPRALHLRVHRRRSCCSASAACSRSTRRTTSGTRSTRATPQRGCSTRRWWWVPLVVLRGGDRDGGVLLPHRDHRVQQDHAATPTWVAVHPPRQGARAAGRPARGLRRADRPGVRAVRRRADPAHRQRLLGRRRHGRDRPAAGRGRGRARASRPRACCSARPPAPTGAAPDPRGARAAPTASSGVIHMRTHAPRPRGAAGRREDRRPPRRHGADVADAIDARRGGDPRGRADRPRDLRRAGHPARSPASARPSPARADWSRERGSSRIAVRLAHEIVARRSRIAGHLRWRCPTRPLTRKDTSAWTSRSPTCRWPTSAAPRSRSPSTRCPA